jgi:hypothetical protein
MTSIGVRAVLSEDKLTYDCDFQAYPQRYRAANTVPMPNLMWMSSRLSATWGIVLLAEGAEGGRCFFTRAATAKVLDPA